MSTTYEEHAKSAQKPYAEDWRCCWSNGRGEHCGWPGSVSYNTRGGGPWYCRVHFFHKGGKLADDALIESLDYRRGEPIVDLPKYLTEPLEDHSEALEQEEPGSGG